MKSNQIEIPISIINELPDALFLKISQMEPVNQTAFIAEFRRKRKSTFLCLFLWVFWLHYAYIGKWWMLFLFWFTLGGLSIWFIIDAFRIHGMIQEYNRSVALKVFRDIQVLW